MAQNSPYNEDFNDQDVQALLFYAERLNPPQNRLYCCNWMTGQAQSCRLSVQRGQFSEHLRTHHGVIGPDKAMVRCLWEGCYLEMKRESLPRHVNERHLELKYLCPHCTEQFTRPYTMHNHVLKKHSS